MGTWDATSHGAEPTPPDSGSQRVSAGTPEDVAALFAWANLQGARYWDFSASRRRYRQQVRAWAAESLRERQNNGSPETGRDASALESPALAGQASVPQASSTRVARPVEAPIQAEQFLRSQRFAAADQFLEVSRDTGRYDTTLLWEPAPVRASKETLPDDIEDTWLAIPWERSNGPQSPVHVPDPHSARQSWTNEAGQAGTPPALLLETMLREDFDSEAALAWREDDNPNEPRPPVTAPRPAWLDHDLLPPHQASAPAEPVGGSPALLIFFTLVRGAGCTSLQAALGRALSCAGERVVLGDAAGRSPLPFYFGAREVRPGLARSYAPPGRSDDPPIFVVNYQFEQGSLSDTAERQVMAEILGNGAGANRILLDLPPGAEGLLCRLATLDPTVIVPLLPDRNTLAALDRVEDFFALVRDSGGEPIQPFYVLNQFEPSLTQHVELSAILESRLGIRLLGPFVRRSPLVAEAFAEGMTVIDYAPASSVAQDCHELASWVRALSPSAVAPTLTAWSTR